MGTLSAALGAVIVEGPISCPPPAAHLRTGEHRLRLVPGPATSDGPAPASPPGDRSLSTRVAENRLFRRRMVHQLAEGGLDQFVDVGTGRAFRPQTHQFARHVQPSARVVYTDPDPDTLTRARAVADPCEQVGYAQAGLSDLAGLLPRLELLDLSRPAAVLLIDVLHLLPQPHDRRQVVRRLTASLAPGSVLVISHGGQSVTSADPDPQLRPDGSWQAAARQHRRHEVEHLLEGLDLLAPGVRETSLWRRDPVDGPVPALAWAAGWAGVGRIPR